MKLKNLYLIRKDYYLFKKDNYKNFILTHAYVSKIFDNIERFTFKKKKD